MKLTTEYLKSKGWVFEGTPTDKGLSEDMWWSYGVWGHKDIPLILRGDKELREKLMVDGHL